MASVPESKPKYKKYKVSLYLDERYKRMIGEIKEWYGQLSINDIVRLAIHNFYWMVRGRKEGRLYDELITLDPRDIP